MGFKPLSGQGYKPLMKPRVRKPGQYLSHKCGWQTELQPASRYIDPVRLPERFNQPVRMSLEFSKPVMLLDHGFDFFTPFIMAGLCKIFAGKLSGWSEIIESIVCPDHGMPLQLKPCSSFPHALRRTRDRNSGRDNNDSCRQENLHQAFPASFPEWNRGQEIVRKYS